MGRSLIITKISPLPESKTPIVCSSLLKSYILKQHLTVAKTVFLIIVIRLQPGFIIMTVARADLQSI